ncbi:Clotting factor B [Nymphon striatum]|nr:Clotting factor B [Nymphon striatum]
MKLAGLKQKTLHPVDRIIVPERYVIRLAEHDITDDNNGQEYDVEEIIVHSEYKPPVAYNDIALLKVKRKITNSSKVQPICLPIGPENSQNLEKISATVIGWGSTAYGQHIAAAILDRYVTLVAYSPQLREAWIPVTSNNHCNESYMKIRALRDYPRGITPNIICAGEINGGKDACQGDSGGPLMTRISHQQMDISWNRIWRLPVWSSRSKSLAIRDCILALFANAHFSRLHNAKKWAFLEHVSMRITIMGNTSILKFSEK